MKLILFPDGTEVPALGQGTWMMAEKPARRPRDRGLREKVFLVSKANPQNASRLRLPQACEASLKRLGTDRLDMYLLHWRGSVPLAETIEAME